MKHFSRRIASVLLSLGFIATAFAAPIPTLAANTGTISGTVTDATSHAPIANVKVSAASPSGSATTTSDAHGYYVLQALIPDTYTVSFQATGYQAVSQPGITVQQGLDVSLNQALSKALKTIATVHASGASNLVKPNQPSDVYTVAGEQLNAISGGNNLHKTLYQYIQGVPGVTSNGFPGQPRIHGQPITDVGYEFDGIPIKDRITGFFTTNLSNVGISNVEVYTGGLSAGDAASGSGVINTVVKTGTYPSTGIISYGTMLGGYRLNDLTAEYSGATPNRRYSWYMALDKTNSLNEYNSGLTYPALEIEGDNGPGPVKTTDIIGNFHYRPSDKDDFQLLFQNGLGDFIFGYLMQRGPNEAPPLTVLPCPGYAAGTSPTGAVGGTAPNGQPCPIGLYFSTAATQNGGGNIWHHYSGLGKLQWNHILNDHSFFALRFSENFNQYIFDQPIAEANLVEENNRSDWGLKGCPDLPYQPGTPVVTTKGGTSGSPCMQQWNWFSTGFTGDRRSNMWLGALDYTNNISANLTIHAGIGDELDNNIWSYYYSLYFNPDGSWPGVDLLSNYPTHIPYVYADAAVKVGKFLLQPGLRYQRESYDYPAVTDPSTGKVTPGGPLSVGIWNPTFAGTYTMGLDDVLRFSYTDSTSFVGSGYIWREVGPGVVSGTYNPGGVKGFSADPTRIHSADLMWEHTVDANTTFKLGPWMNKTSNAFILYRPFTGIDPTSGKATYGPTTPSNAGIRQAFGFEMALNHVDHRKSGISYWLTGTYDNFWTSITSDPTSSYGVSPLPPSLIAAGNLIRSTGNPLFSGTLTLDMHQDDVSLLPMIYYQGPTFYNTNQLSCSYNCKKGTLPQITQNNMKAVGYWIMNATALWRINGNPNLVLGIQGTNVLNNVHDTVPCKSSYLPSIGYGCGPFWAAGNPAQTGYIYQNYSQSPAQWQLFLTKKF